MRRRAHGNTLAFRLLAGWCGLLLYVGALSPLGMGVGTLLGMIDPDHHAILQPGVDGMRLVLRHQGNCSAHHHGPVVRALTMFAQPASATDSDHIVQFSPASNFMRESQPAIPTPNQSESKVIQFSPLSALVTSAPVKLIFKVRPPPDHAGQFLCIRSTVFLV